ncbi:MAG: o-succinylbenzoate synthase [Anaerolineales bacterium]
MTAPAWQLEVARVDVHPVMVPLVQPFETSFGVQQERAAVLVHLQTADGVSGWGEVTAGWEPGYSYETVHTALHILSDFLVPGLLAQRILTQDGPWDWLNHVRGHPLAKHGLLSAILTAVAAQRDEPLAGLLESMAGAPSRHKTVSVGVSIGIQPSIEATLSRVSDHIHEGYRRIKLKIKPGWDVAPLRAVRAAFPDVMLMADANSAYSLADTAHLVALDDLGLLMIEQPLAHDDIYEHSRLAQHLSTPICLDESLHSLSDVQVAHALNACRVVNLKPQRVGGLFNAVKIYQFCVANGLDVWVGGMLELGIGRAVSLALASLPGISLPSDLSATQRYYDQDIATPAFELRAGSRIAPPEGPGLGVTVDMERVTEAETAFYAAQSTQK